MELSLVPGKIFDDDVSMMSTADVVGIDEVLSAFVGVENDASLPWIRLGSRSTR